MPQLPYFTETVSHCRFAVAWNSFSVFVKTYPVRSRFSFWFHSPVLSTIRACLFDSTSNATANSSASSGLYLGSSSSRSVTAFFCLFISKNFHNLSAYEETKCFRCSVSVDSKCLPATKQHLVWNACCCLGSCEGVQQGFCAARAIGSNKILIARLTNRMF